MAICSEAGCERPTYARGFCNPHYQRWRRSYAGPQLSNIPVGQRFWSKVNRQPGGCWLWTGGVGSSGYGIFGRPSQLAHRVAYELEVGPIPDGLELDHLCRVRTCVNLAHLEPVTARINSRRSESFSGQNSRKEFCVNGHEFTQENTRVRTRVGGGRTCRACDREKARRYRERHHPIR